MTYFLPLTVSTMKARGESVGMMSRVLNFRSTFSNWLLLSGSESVSQLASPMTSISVAVPVMLTGTPATAFRVMSSGSKSVAM